MLYKDLRILYSHNKRKLSDWNLERNRSYRITFLFHWCLGIRVGKLPPGVGILFRFFDLGPEFCTEKLSPGRGFWRKKLVARGGDGNRSNWYLHYTQHSKTGNVYIFVITNILSFTSEIFGVVGLLEKTSTFLVRWDLTLKQILITKREKSLCKL